MPRRAAAARAPSQPRTTLPSLAMLYWLTMLYWTCDQRSLHASLSREYASCNASRDDRRNASTTRRRGQLCPLVGFAR